MTRPALSLGSFPARAALISSALTLSISPSTRPTTTLPAVLEAELCQRVSHGAPSVRAAGAAA